MYGGTELHVKMQNVFYGEKRHKMAESAFVLGVCSGKQSFGECEIRMAASKDEHSFGAVITQ